MKIGIFNILKAHLNTLYIYSDSKERYSIFDIVLFYFLPLLLGIISAVLCVELQQGFYSLSVSVFSIFLALLLSAQVAIYSIYRSENNSVGHDPISETLKEESKTTKKALIKEINANISYLILLSCLSSMLSLVFYATSSITLVAAPIMIALYIHFLLTILMVIKRTFNLFDDEYT